MTIAIGMLARGNVVLASDTQETAGSFKADVRKIGTTFVRGDSPRVVAIAGAGYGPYIDRVTGPLSGLFEHEQMTADRWQPSIEEYLADFYKTHFTPFGDRDLDIALLIGSHQGGTANLLVTNRSTARPEVWMEAIGVGAMTAKNLLKELHSVSSGLDVAVMTAAYVIWKTKQSITDCGHFTDIIVVTAKSALSIERYIVASWETVFSSCDYAANAVLRAAFDPIGQDVHPAPQSIEQLRKQFDPFRTGIAKFLSDFAGPEAVSG